MAIPESQLTTWSHQGSISQSSSTYQTIRNALLAKDSGYADKFFEVFLQGSYGNKTNIYAESDIDVVIRLTSTFQGDIAHLDDAQKQAYHNHYPSATYTFDEFKKAVIKNLQNQFGTNSISVGKKAIKVQGSQNRRNADVVACYEYRSFKSFSPYRTDDYVSGIIFSTTSGEIINYPKQHSVNLTSQHQSTNEKLKPMVRILKNMRSYMVDKGLLKDGIAPSYYIEGLFYNVPSEQYAKTYGDTFCNGINWLLKADKTKLVCANWRYYLLGNSNVQWKEDDFNTFLSAVCDLWNDWK
jgi:hypothetical protein